MITIRPDGDNFRVSVDDGASESAWVETVLLNGCKIDVDRALNLPDVQYNIADDYAAFVTPAFVDQVKYDHAYVGESKDRSVIRQGHLKPGDAVKIRLDFNGRLNDFAAVIDDVHDDCFDCTIMDSNGTELKGVSPNLVIESLDRNPII